MITTTTEIPASHLNKINTYFKKNVVSEIKSLDKPFSIWLIVVSSLAFLTRVLFVSLAKWHQYVWNDGGWYHCTAQVLLNTHKFIEAVPVMKHGLVTACIALNYPTAAHPPLWIVVLSICDIFSLNTLGSQLIVNCIIGTLAVTVLMVTAKRIAGKRVAIIAGIIGALYPGMWLETGQLTAETLALLTANLSLLAFYKLIDKPTTKSAVLLGLWCALAALTRSELALTGILFPATIYLHKGFRKFSAKHRIKLALVVIFSMGLTMAPWLIRNNLEFNHFTLTSTELGFTLDMANCNQTYFAPHPGSTNLDNPSFEGYWTLSCALNRPPNTGEGYDNSYYTTSAEKYIKNNIYRFPTVAVIRVGRLWQLFDPLGQARLDFLSEQWNLPGDWVKIFSLYAMTPFILIGVFILRKKRKIGFPLAVYPIIATFSVAFITEDPRYRVMSEGAISIVAAIGISFILDKIQEKRQLPPKWLDLNPNYTWNKTLDSTDFVPSETQFGSFSSLLKKLSIKSTTVIKPSRKTYILSFLSLVFLFGILSISFPMLSGPDEAAAVIHAAGAAHGQLTGKAMPDPDRNYSLSYSPFELIKLPNSFIQVTSYANCFGLSGSDASCAKFYGKIKPGSSYVVSYQGRYPPWYFAAIGSVSLFTSRTLMIYLMRFLSLILSALLVASAIQAILERKRLRIFGLLGLVLAISPSFITLQAVIGPSATESAAGLCFWAASLRLLTDPFTSGKRQIMRVGLSLSIFVLSRPDSPLWAGISIIFILLGVAKKENIVYLIKQSYMKLWIAIGFVSTLVTLTWDKLEQATNVLGYTYKPPFNWFSIFHYTIDTSPTYLAQQVSSYGEKLPGILVIVDAAVILSFVIITLLTSTFRAKFTILLFCIVIWLIPVVSSALVFPKAGFIWQGRYSLSVSIGLPILCSFLIGEKQISLRKFQLHYNTIKLQYPLVAFIIIGIVYFLSFFYINYQFMAGTTTPILIKYILDPPWQPPLTSLGFIVLCAISIIVFLRLIYRFGKNTPDSIRANTEFLDSYKNNLDANTKIDGTNQIPAKLP